MKTKALWFAMGFALGFCLFLMASTADAAVDLSVTPTSQTVSGGTVVDLEVRVPTQANLEFNTWGADIAVTGGLSLGGVTEGPYLYTVCGNTFWSWNGTRASGSLLCAQQFVQGPGTLALVKVTANGTGTVTLSNVAFYRAGQPVTVGTVTPATITVSGGGGGGCHGCELDKASGHETWSKVKGLYAPPK